MSIIRVEKNRNYTVTHNSGARDKRLSWGAKGILWYALTRPDNWELNLHDLKSWAPEGEHAIQRMLGELKRCGYLQKQRHRHPNGTWQWVTTIYEVAQDCSPPQNPPRENPPLVNPLAVDPVAAGPPLDEPRAAEPSTRKPPPIEQTSTQQIPNNQIPVQQFLPQVPHELPKNLPALPLAPSAPAKPLSSAQRREHAWTQWISDLTDP